MHYVKYPLFMKALIEARRKRHLSQRRLATLAGLSYKTIQLMEEDGTDARLSTVHHVFRALGYPAKSFERYLQHALSLPADSICVVSEYIALDGAESWKTHVFNFVDAFRQHATRDYIDCAPVDDLPENIGALCAAIVETLCVELNMDIPTWCAAMPVLKTPWFVSESEVLKPFALVESPVHFRKRNIFVLGNFLERA